jgi:hypothetical protein
MANGTIVPGTARQDGVRAYVSILVAEGGQLGNVEYTAQTTLNDLQGNPKTVAQIKADLIASAKAARDNQLGAGITGVAISGAVTL